MIWPYVHIYAVHRLHYLKFLLGDALLNEYVFPVARMYDYINFFRIDSIYLLPPVSKHFVLVTSLMHAPILLKNRLLILLMPVANIYKNNYLVRLSFRELMKILFVTVHKCSPSLPPLIVESKSHSVTVLSASEVVNSNHNQSKLSS